MNVTEYINKAVISILHLSEAQIDDIFKNPNDYAFDVEAEKFYKIADTQFKTVINFDDFNAALDDGWKFDKVLNFGSLPTKIQVRKRNYLSADSSL